MLKWTKIPSFSKYVAAPTDTAYILPCDKGITIVYNDEQCVIENVDVQEFMVALKLFEDSPSFRTDFKSTIECAANHLILPQKLATT
jgi:hypothetical protein